MSIHSMESVSKGRHDGFASYNRNWAYDPSDVGFTAIPEFDRFTLNPTLFFYPGENTTANLGIEAMVEDRLGGDMDYIRNGYTEEHPYFERNRSQRYSSRLSVRHKFNEAGSLNVKNSVTLFRRKISIPDYRFDGDQWSSFSEVLCEFSGKRRRMGWVVLTYGQNISAKKQLTPGAVRDFSINTSGVFVQEHA